MKATPCVEKGPFIMNNTIEWGNFSLFGFIKKNTSVKRQLLQSGITPQFVNFGTEGQLFLYSSYGDIAESEEAIGLKLGFIRSKTHSPLSTQQLLEQKSLQPNHVDHHALCGNALLICFSKVKPEFCAYQTIMAPIPLYCFTSEQEIICTTDIRRLLNLLEHVELSQKAIPMHFLFGFSIGSSTYFRNIWRLTPGQLLRWSNGSSRTQLVQDFHLPDNVLKFKRIDKTSVNKFYEGMNAVMRAYKEELTDSNPICGSLLSGGVDSSLIQILINEQFPQANKPPSFSYAVKTQGFEFEIEYAKHASELLQTQHTFVPITPQDIPDLLWKTVKILGQPNLYVEAVPCHLALVEFLAQNEPTYRYFFIGQGADGLHGVSEQKKMAIFKAAQQMPGSDLMLRSIISLLSPWAKSKAHGLQEVVNMLDTVQNPNSTLPVIYSPLNYVALFGGGTMAYRCFGNRVIQETLDYRNELEASYLNSPELIEKIQVIDLLTASYETAVAMNQLYLAKGKEGIFFYLDEDIIRMAFAINPKIRFLKGLTTKPMLKRALSARSLSTLAAKRKGGSVFHRDLFMWMQQGPLQDMVQAIERPSFMDKSLFEEVLNKPGPFLWLLLTFDIFKKQLQNI